MLKYSELPFVSICTPTFNRRPFIPYAIKCIQYQDYPKEKIEWIVVDDGTDKVEDLFKDVEDINIKYFYYDEKMTLGKKRNLVHEKTKGDILIYMDDDDYYPPNRISHAVEMLVKNPSVICAGSSKMYSWSSFEQKMFTIGPYGPNHATAGTFAFKRKLLAMSKYDESAAFAEERSFLKNYTIPFIQLDPEKTIVVFAHDQNTYDKRMVLSDKNTVCQPSDKSIEYFIKDKELRDFYRNGHNKISEYKAGIRENKRDVMEQLQKANHNNFKISMMKRDGTSDVYTIQGIIDKVIELQNIIERQHKELIFMKTHNSVNSEFINIIEKQNKEIESLKKRNFIQDKLIKQLRM